MDEKPYSPCLPSSIHRLYKHSSNTCARIQITETVIVPPNSEKFAEGKIDFSCIQDRKIGIIETTSYIKDMGCLLARSLVDPTQNKAVFAIVNLSDHAVKINSDSSEGTIQTVEQVYTDEGESTSSLGLPVYLKDLVDNASDILTNAEQRQLSQLLTVYQDIFVGSDGQLGQTNIVEYEINILDAEPIKIPPRRIPIFKRQTVDEEIDKMLSENITEPSDSPWSALICLIKKKDGSCRFCIDFRAFNSLTQKDAYPLPRIDDTLENLAGSRWYCTLDLASGYWQIKLSENSKK